MKLNNRLFETAFNLFSVFPVEKLEKSDSIDNEIVEKLVATGFMPEKTEYLYILSNQSDEWKKEFIEYLDNRIENAGWFKTLFTKTEVENELESILVLKTLLHYATVELKLIQDNSDLDTYFPNLEIMQIKTWKKEDIKNNIKVFKVDLIDNFFEEFAEYIVSMKKVINEEERYILTEYKEQLKKYIENKNIYFKENKIELIKLGYELNKLNMEDVIRFFNINVIGKPLAIYTKELKNIKNSDVISDCVKDKVLTLVDNVYEKNKEKTLGMFKQKRKLIKKMLSICGFKSKYKLMRNGQEIYNILYHNKNVQKLDSDYSLIRKGVVTKPSMIKENFDYAFKNLDDAVILENLLKLPLTTQVQVVNYIRKIKNKLEFFERGEKEYFYILPHSYYADEIKIDAQYYKNNKDRLEKIEKELISNIKSELNKNIKDLKIHKRIFEKGIRLAFPFSLRMEDNNDFYFEKGSYFETDKLKNVRIGIYWENVGNKSVDLDLNSLHLLKSNEVVHIGWNGSKRFFQDDLKMVYSGDIRDGRFGAAEFVEIKNKDVLRYSLLSVSNFHNVNHAWYMAGIALFDENEDVKIYNGIKQDVVFNFNPDKLIFGFKNKFIGNINTHIVFLADYENNKVYPVYLQDTKNVLNKGLFRNYLNRILIEKDNLKIDEIIDEALIVDDSYEKEDENERIIYNASELVYEFLKINK